jgi:hypothetical protein
MRWMLMCVALLGCGDGVQPQTRGDVAEQIAEGWCHLGETCGWTVPAG